jgi:hypothetical protein
MTLLGKIFTMLIFIMALVWMAFAVAVYMTQKNWKDLVDNPKSGLKQKLKELEEANEELRVQLTDKETELRREEAARAHALAALEEARQGEAAARQTAETAQAQLTATSRAALAEAAATQTRLKAVTDEIAQARVDIKTAQADRDDKLQRVVALTDQLHQAEDTRRRLFERQQEIAAQVGRMKAVLDAHGLHEYTPLDGLPPIGVNGIVTAVRKEFMEISIGSDDGLMVGHELEVFKDRTYKGRVVVRRVDPDRAVAEVVPELRKGEIQPGDRAVTRTSVGSALTPTVR